MRQKTIKKRLMASMIGISIIPIIALSIFTFAYLSQNLRREFVATNETRISWAYQYADTVIQQLQDSLYGLRLNQTLISSMNYSEGNELQKKQYLIDTLNQTLYSNSNIINEIILYDYTSGNMSVLNYRSGGTFVTRHVNNTVFTPLLDNPSGLMFVTYHGNTYVIQSINRFDGQAFIGGIALRLNKQVMSSFDEILGSDQGTHYIYGPNQTLIGGTKNDDITTFMSLHNDQVKPKSILHESYQDDFVWVTSTSRHELTIVKTIPIEAFDQAFRPISYITVAIAMVALAISVFIAYLISNRISEPISRIVTKMQQAPLDEIRVTSDHYDEIAQLERGYNEMTEAIKKLIIEKYKKNLELKTAQLKALQSQMNPHFLNNTFQLIGGMALAIKADNIYEVTSSMGEMMKYALTKDEELLTLDEEVRHTINYLDIQKQRFIDKVDTKIHFDKTLANYLIPKFTLQPLVENSFKHGFTSKDKAWKIDVDIKLDKDIIVTVKDNGIGMTDEKAKEINKLLSEASTHLIQDQISDSTGIGLGNIHQRIQLLFGTNYGLHVEARKSGGTTIIVRIPKKKKEVASHV